MRLTDIIALLSPVLLCLSFVAIVLTIILCPLWIAVILCAIFFYFNAYYECFAYKGFRLSNSNDCPRSLTLVSFNVNLAYKELSTGEKAQKIADFLLDEDADFVLLQEYNPQLFPVIQQKLENNYQYGSPYQIADRYKAVYSKYPISDYIQLEDERKTDERVVGCEDRGYLPICGMTITVGGKELYVVNCHLHSNNYSSAFRKLRRKEVSLLQFFKEAISLLSQGIEQRKRQVRILTGHLGGIIPPLLICGDMNDVSGSIVMKMMIGKALKDAWWQKGLGFGFTLATIGMRWRLDHVLNSEGIKIDSIKVGCAGLSDHRPLICKFNLL